MKNYIAIFVAILFFGSTGIVFAAPVFNLFGNVAPSQNQVFDLGTTTPALEWKNVYTKNLFVSGTCTGCGGGSTFGQAWELFGSGTYLAPTTTKPIIVNAATSTITNLVMVNSTTTNATTTFASFHTVFSDASDGLILNAANGTNIANFGLANSANSLFYGGVNINGATRIATSITGLLKATAGAITAATAGVDYLLSYDAWTHPIAGVSATTSSILITASSTIGSGTQAGGLTISGGATTTGNLLVQGTGTSTFDGNSWIKGNLQVDGKFFAPVSLVSSGDATINGALTVTGALDFDSFTSALLLTGAGGDVAEYAGTSCTNQFIRSVNGAGVATCASVSLSADVTGDLPFANITQLGANSVWANNTSATADGASVSTSTLYGVGNYGDLLMYNSGLKLTATSSLFVFSPAFSTTNSIKNVVERSFTYSTSTAWTGTTTIPLLQATIASTYSGFRCKTYITGNAPGGTLNIQLGKYSASTTMATASSTNNYNAFSSNNTVAAGDSWYVDIGTPASSPMKINCTYQILI